MPQDVDVPDGVVRAAGDETAFRLAARILNISPVPTLYLSAGLVFLQCNAAAASLLGIPAEQLLGKSLESVAGPDSRLLGAASSAAVTRQSACAQLRARGGGPRHLATFTPDVNAKGRLLGLIATFVEQRGETEEQAPVRPSAEEEAAAASLVAQLTESRRSQMELLKLLELYKAAVEHSPQGIAIADVYGHVLLFNPAMERIFGHTAEEINEVGWFDLAYDDPADRAVALGVLERGMREGPIEIAQPVVRADGERIFVHFQIRGAVIDGRQVALVFAHDVNDARSAELALKESEALFRTIFELSPAGAALLDSSGRLVRVNRHLADMLGYPIRQLERMRLAEVTCPDDVEATQGRLERLVSGESDEFTVEKRYVRADGSQMWALLSLAAIRSSESSLLYVVAVVYDITEQKQAEEAAARTAVEQARLYDTEHQLADTLQDALIRMPEEVQGVRFCWLYRSATEAARVGGDFLDVFELGGSRVGIVVGDVSGKGVEASALTTLAKNSIRAYAYDGVPPAAVMERLNRTVDRETPTDVFLTAFFGVLDTDTGWLRYCSAGHPPGLLRRADGSCRELRVISPLVGALPEMTYEEGFEQLGADDVLLLVSDGVIEARNDVGELFGDERLRTAFAAAPLSGICEGIYGLVSGFSAGSLEDDVAILGITLARAEDEQDAA